MCGSIDPSRRACHQNGIGLRLTRVRLGPALMQLTTDPVTHEIHFYLQVLIRRNERGLTVGLFHKKRVPDCIHA